MPFLKSHDTSPSTPSLRPKRSFLRSSPPPPPTTPRSPLHISAPTSVVIHQYTTEAAALAYFASASAAPPPPPSSSPKRSLRRALSLRDAASRTKSLRTARPVHLQQQQRVLTLDEAALLSEVGVAVDQPPLPAKAFATEPTLHLAAARASTATTASCSSGASSISVPSAGSSPTTDSTPAPKTTSARPALHRSASLVGLYAASPAPRARVARPPPMFNTSFFTDSDSDYGDDDGDVSDAESVWSVGEVCVARRAVRCTPLRVVV